MKQMIQLIENAVESAFSDSDYDKKYGKVTLSNRPDLCEFQCNGALAAAKEYKTAPIRIAEKVAEVLQTQEMFESVEAVKPGFLNFKLSKSFLTEYLNTMYRSDKFGFEKNGEMRTIMIDYGGPNVAKPLHVGHLRAAIIGESLKRISRFVGHNVIGDVHLGDWGFQMGLIITELAKRKPELPYFDDTFEGDYPKEAPFTISELEEIYPYASAKSKEDETYKEAALAATYELQQGRRGYRAIWQHIIQISVTDLKKNYEKLQVTFDLWKGESDAQPYIPDMVHKMKEEGYAYISDGALVVDVKEETDTKEVPPCMILKSDGASLYNTTDLATIIWRMKEYHPDKIQYVVDKRQDLYFTQVFRCARKTGLVEEDTKLQFIGFGTMNGKDGKPFKTRAGGVMRLESLLNEIEEQMYQKISENATMSDAEARNTAKIVALSAVKYGDLSNQASKDYVFDVERFTSFEGNTGPYILYTIVRIKSILGKYENMTGAEAQFTGIPQAQSESQKALMLKLSEFSSVVETAFLESAPHKVCAYIYELSNALNRFYHETKILATENENLQKGYLSLLILTKNILELCIDLLGFTAPEKM